MSELKHTKGPWQLSTVIFEMRATDSAGSIYGPPSKEGGACLIADVSRSPGDEEATANSYLIAAAPDLLSALIELNDAYNELAKTEGMHGNIPNQSARVRLLKASMKAEETINKATKP